jgi:arylsulfatase A-like enzyme
VHGLAGVPPAVVDAPVRLADVMPTVLTAAGIDAPPRLAGRPLPTDGTARDAPAVDIVAEHDDSSDDHEGDDAPLTASIRNGNRADRRACGPDDRVFGEMRALVRYPLKLIWYARYAAELYDLAADGDELNDLAPTSADTVARLAAALRAATDAAAHSAAPLGTRPAADGTLAPAGAERLRRLGYLDAPPSATPPP